MITDDIKTGYFPGTQVALTQRGADAKVCTSMLVTCGLNIADRCERIELRT
jgi:hypothetical protein